MGAFQKYKVIFEPHLPRLPARQVWFKSPCILEVTPIAIDFS